jgi:putative membrane-bound dehydrogenase-like protein
MFGNQEVTVMSRFSLAFVLLAMTAIGHAADGNRLAYLDGPLDPYYPHRDFPKLITPQWVGEEGVECVVTLAIDDMRESAKYEAFLRPILERLKKIDGRAPVSIMSCRVDPADPQLQTWLKVGLSIEVHTFDHPCPCLQDGGLARAKETYDKCVDLMNEIPGNKPVAFRMPCCDSLNTPSPRFWAEAFNKTTAKGNFLQIDSSVFNIITSKDKDLPKEITELPDGSQRFRRYVPFANFVNTIEDYPYPYVIGGMCWEFPCVVPSDWSAQHVQKPNNPDTVRDWKLALDACVIKQGTFNLVFHPHGWIRNDQIVELIDHAVAKHGKKVKFLTFKECAERLNKNLLLGQPIRLPDGTAAGVTVADMGGDGFIDVGFQTATLYGIRTWDSGAHSWNMKEAPIRPQVERPSTSISTLDLDGDGSVEIVRKSGLSSTVVTVRGEPLVKFPMGVSLNGGKDTGARIVDVNGDGKLDCLFSNHERYSLHLFKNMKEGWATKVIDGVRGRAEGNIGPEIPPFVRADGTNNGAWFHSDALWLQNEDTWRLPDHVFKLTFKEMLGDRGQGAVMGTDRSRTVASAVPGTQYSVLSTKKSASSSASPDSRSPTPPKIEMTRPLSPQESLAALHVRPGFKVELVAAEPLVVDLVAFDWGPDGRLWVVEMRDYPNGITWNKEGDKFGEPGGRVKVLTDIDGDGKYDKAETFLDELPFPTGVKVWRKGILVTAAPDILYAEDTNGDDKADVRKVLYKGFGEGNQQHRVNGLRWGLDNWLYVGNGDSGGVIKAIAAVSGPLAPRADDRTRSVPATSEVNVNGRDLRIRPDTGEIDAQSGQTQFGRERDDWGNWFGGNNSNPMWHYTLEDHYLRRNPHVAPPSVRKQVSVSPGAAPVFPRSKTLARFNDFNMANRFTSACSQMIYRDELLGPEFAGNMFVCEPVHNLVSRESVSPQGTTFTSRRAKDEQQSEFLASEDNWFRPSMVRTGPDGALWVSDMYRFVIEHPKWIPAEFQSQLQLRAGDDKGRIYRIYPANAKPRPIARLDKLDTAGLVAALDAPNGPQRDLVQQMLIWRADKAAVKPLVQLMMKAERPVVRMQALCTLDGLGGLVPETVVLALNDKHPGVRRHAVRLAEPWIGKVETITDGVQAKAFDEDLQVKMQVAYSLGQSSDPAATVPLGRLLLDAGNDPYLTAAALSSVNKDNVGRVLARVLAADKAEPPAAVVEKLLSIAAATGNDAAFRDAVDQAVRMQAEEVRLWQLAAIGRLLDELDRKKINLSSLIGGDAKESLARLFARARAMARGEDAAANKDIAYRTAAIRLLARGLDSQDDDVALLASLLVPQQPDAVQGAALAALARQRPSELPATVLAGWSSHTPALRSQILDTLTSREPWSLALLDAVEKGQIPSGQIDARRRQQLATAKSDAVRMRAEKVLAATVNTNRQQVVEQYLKAASAHTADAGRGIEVFAKRCANCHRLEGAGHSVGPDLAALTDRSTGAMYVAVLDPNRAVEDKYLDYLVRLADGRTASGMLREETGTSITLAAAEGKTATILRSEIEQLASSGKSLMPEGVEKDITPAEMADLAAYLASSSPPPKKLAGNSPEVVRPFVDGSIRLLATNARVYGPTLILEEKYRNLGWWSSQEDHCAWTFENPTEGEYRVVLDYACAKEAAGNSAIVTVAGQTLGCVVEGTGTWDDYRGKDIGVVKLPAGTGELVVKSDGPIKAALLDLRGVRLAPVKR